MAHQESETDHSAGISARRRTNIVRLGLFCLSIALFVVVVVVLLTPPDDTETSSAGGEGELEKAVIPAATVELATTPLEISNEDLQAELVSLLEEMVGRYATSPHALHVAASAYSRMHRTNRAEELWTKCIDLDPRHVGPRLGLARLMAEKGDDAESIRLLEDALAASCSSAELYYRLAEANSKMGDVERAEAVMIAGVQAYPGVAINWLLLGQTQNQLQKFVEAERSLRKALAYGSKSSEVLFALTNACQRQGKDEEANEFRKKFTELKKAGIEANKEKPFQEIYQQALRPIAAGSITSSAAVYAAQGDAATAMRLFLRANALEPDSPLVLEELAIHFRDQSKLADSLVVQRRLVELEPTNVTYRVNLANFASQLGDWSLAEKSLQEALRLKPELALPYMGLAQVYAHLGDLEKARQYALSAVERGPSPDGYSLLAVICEEQGDMDAANAARQAAQRMTTSGQPPVGQMP